MDIIVYHCIYEPNALTTFPAALLRTPGLEHSSLCRSVSEPIVVLHASEERHIFHPAIRVRIEMTI